MADNNETKAVYMAENQLQESKSNIGEYTLPCGWLTPEGTLERSVKLRIFTGAEEDMLANDRLDSSAKMDLLLQSCTAAIGTVVDPSRFPAILSQLPLGDRVFLLLSARRQTLGDVFPYIAACPVCPNNRKDLYTVSLDELTIRPMPDPYKRVYDLVLSNGVEVRWHVLTGQREAKMQAYTPKQRRENAVTMSILSRLELYDGRPPTLHQIRDLGTPQRNELRDAFAECEGGVDTAVSFECVHCGHAWEEDLDISQPGFFSPSAAQRRWKRKST